jgi:hypothetical protein
MPANAAPSGADNAISVVENGEYTFAAADFGFSDNDANSLLAVKIAALPAAGHLFFNGGAVNMDDVMSVADIDSGLFKYVADPDGYGTAHASFAFQVQDNGGTAGGGIDLDPSPNTMTINVGAMADMPSITPATTNEDTQGTSGLVISRNASDGGEVAYFKITNIQHGTLFLHDGTTVVTSGDFIDFAAANAGLKFTPDANFNGIGTFAVQASLSNSDAGLGGGVIAASVNVAAVNDIPTVAPATTAIDIYEDGIGGSAQASFQVTTFDADQNETGATVTQGLYGTVTSSAPNSALTTVTYQLNNSLDAAAIPTSSVPATSSSRRPTAGPTSSARWSATSLAPMSSTWH